jgi:hypothetical protein
MIRHARARSFIIAITAATLGAIQLPSGLIAASTASAREAGVPKIDLQQRCEDSRRAMYSLAANLDSFDSCMRAENDSLAKLSQVWNDIPGSIRSQCVDPGGFSPSYIEWQTCVEVARDVRKLRAETPTTIPTSKNCPIIQMRQDGSIVSVLACGLRKYGM